jgi:hypothetical protein
MTLHQSWPWAVPKESPFRRKIADEIERLILLLDSIDRDPDLEDGGDNEPWLGMPEKSHQPDKHHREDSWHFDDRVTRGDDRELEDEHYEDDGTAELSFGAPEKHVVPTFGRWGEFRDRSGDQTNWAGGEGRAKFDECEIENEHGGDVNDEPHDGDPDEYSLGWEQLDQTELQVSDWNEIDGSGRWEAKSVFTGSGQRVAADLLRLAR